MKKINYLINCLIVAISTTFLLCGCGAESKPTEVFLMPGENFNAIVSNQFSSLSFVTQKPDGANPKTDIDVSLNMDRSVLLYKDGYEYFVYPAYKDAKIIANFDCSSMFANCENLTRINFENLDTSYTTDFSYMFCGCVALADASTFDKLSVDATDNIDSIFYNCGIDAKDALNIWFPNIAQSVKTKPEADTGLKVIYVDVVDYKGSLIQYTFLTEAVTYNYFIQNCGIFEFTTRNGLTFCSAVEGYPIDIAEYMFNINGSVGNCFLSSQDVITVKPISGSSGITISLKDLDRVSEGNEFDSEHPSQGKTTLISRFSND